MKNKKRILITSGILTFAGLLFVGAFSGISGAIRELYQKHAGQEEIVDGSYVDGKIMVKMKARDIGNEKASQKLAKGRSILARDSSINSIDKVVLQQEEDEGEYIWYECSLDSGTNIKDAIEKMENVAYVECAEPVYIRTIDGEALPPSEGEETYTFEDYVIPTDDINLIEAQKFLEQNEINKGGSNDIIVAVLDTGVDYNHPALKNNMWINTAEIPGNGIDDDENGFVDDIYGASVLGSRYDFTGDPMDVHGHGTHVAGIIAANKVDGQGIQGVANNVRIMAIRAGQPSGVFTTSSIVEGITYAYKMGADVLNMSFGGYTKSQLEIDALQRAYNTTVLVAAAGNDTLPNYPNPYGRNSYPGSLPWVVGVMSSDSAASPTDPSYLSYFSNVDYYAGDSWEYEVAAPGNKIMSSLPNNKYDAWSGTSMACPVVSGVAALLRSYFTDKVEYTSRFIMGQISSTGNEAVYPTPYHSTMNPVFKRVDAYKALTARPQPKLELYDFFIDDSPEINERNDGDGALDSGETVYLGISIKNLWGKATNVSVSLDSLSVGDVADPYIEYIRDTVSYLDVGAWEELDNGWIRDGDSAILGINPDEAFIIHVADNTPNDIVHAFNVTIRCTNGMDPEDTTNYVFAPRQGEGITYTPENYFTITSRNGRELPSVISEDTTLTKDFYWIMPSTTRIEEGVTVTVEAGTQIQFYSSEDASVYAQDEIVNLIVKGKFITLGTPEEPVELFPSPLHPELTVNIDGQYGVFLNYTNIENPCVNANQINSCYFYQDQEITYNYRLNTDVGNIYKYYQNVYVYAESVKNSIFYNLGMVQYPYYQFVVSDWYCQGAAYDCCLFNQCYMTVSYQYMSEMTNCVFLNNSITNEWGDVYSSSIKDVNANENSTILKVFERESDGTVYILYAAPSYNSASRFAHYLGGYIVSVNDEDEYNFLRTNCSDNYYLGYTYDGTHDISYWEDGTVVTYDLLDSSANKSQIGGRYHVFGGSGYSTWTINSSYYSDGQRFLLEIPQKGIIKNITFADQMIEIDEETAGYAPLVNVFPSTANRQDLVYSSTDENVFVVNEQGEITATGKGVAELVVSTSDNYISKSITVKVVDKVAVENVQADVDDLFLEVNDSYQLNIEYTPTNTTEKLVIYESTNPDVVSVDNTGLVTAKAVGSADIKIYDANGTLRQTIHVQTEILVDEVKNSEDIYYSYVGQSFDLSVSHAPSTATLYKYEFESSNPDIATVDENGHVEILKEGYALLRVKDKYSGAYFDINVSATGTFIEEPKMIDVVFTDNAYYALSDEGNVYVWGNGITKTTKLASLRNVTNIFGYYCARNALALTSDGALYVLYCEGSNYQVDKVNSPEPVVRAFVLRDKYYFEVESGGIYAFGQNHYGSLGIGSEEDSSVSYSSPKLVFAYGNVKTIVGTYRTTFILTNDHETYFCGRNEATEFTDFSIELTWDDAYNCSDWSYVMVKTTNGSFYYVYEDNFSVNSVWALNNYFNKYDLDSSSIDNIYFNSADYYVFVTKEGKVRANAYNEYSKFGSYLSNSWIYCYDDYSPYDGFEVKKVVLNSYNTAIITAEGRIYMMGYSANGRMGFNGTGNVKTPKQVYFDVQVPGSLEVLSSNLSRTEMNSNVDPKQNIEIKFNQGVVKGTGFNNIKVVDRNGNKIDFNKELTINGIIISPIGRWNSNTSYTLTVPSGAVSNNFGDSSSMISISFTSGSVLVDSLTFNDVISIDSATTNYLPDFSVSPMNADLTTLNWASTDESVFVVDNNGRITAKGLGTAQLVVTSSDGFLRRVNTVTVFEHVGIESFTIGKDNYELIYGDTALIETTIVPTNATEPLSFISNDESVVVVSASGLIQTVGTGNTTITVSNNKGTIVKTINVSVDRDVESVSCDAVIYGLVGQTQQLNVEINPENATRVNLTYTSDNEEYVKVSETGLVTFLKAGLSNIRIEETNSKTTLDVMISVSESLVDEVKLEKVVVCSDLYYALDTKGNVWMWGNNHALPSIVATNVKDLAGSGQYNNLVILLNKDNSVSYIDYQEVRTTSLTDIESVYAFGGKLYAVTSDDVLYGFGNNSYYSLGAGDNDYIFWMTRFWPTSRLQHRL